jgi:bla regulator protein BlaR1
MNLIQTSLQAPWLEALGWTFVHSFWQIAVIGLFLYIVLRCIPGRSAHVRYTLATLALWTTLVTSFSTFILMLPETKSVNEIMGNVVLVGSTEHPSFTAALKLWLEHRMPMMLSIWLGGVAILLLRLLISLGWVSHLRYDSFPEEDLQRSLDHVVQKLKLRVRPTASESLLIKSPLTIGHLKPLILFPVGIINQLSPVEVEAILTHELAHIVRKDYLSNIIQSCIETLFYYHPVTWWISRVVRTERENRADDLAVSWCGDHLGYAKALMTVQEMQLHHTPGLTMGFASPKRAMLMRIQRILNLPYKNHNQMEKIVLLSLCSICFLAFSFTGSTHELSREKMNQSLVMNAPKPAIRVDSLPSKGIYKIHKKTDDQDISVEVRDGDIKSLTVDGKTIQPSEFDQYGKAIDDLFGSIETPPTADGFPGTPAPPMPPVPGMPGMPAMPPIPPMTPMPPMAPMPDMHVILNNRDLYALLGDLGQMHIVQDSTSDGNTKIIIINGQDSTLVCAPHIAWSGETPPAFSWSGDGPKGFAFDDHNWNSEEMKKWKDEWKAQAEDWKAQQKSWQDQRRAQQEKFRDEMQREYQPYIENHPDLEENAKAAEELAREIQGEISPMMRNGRFGPRVSLSEEMVRDGLIRPGEEAEVQLTPGKLKINGHKMSDELHAKYLKMYEQQQGIELSGNSKVEFKTKSHEHM